MAFLRNKNREKFTVIDNRAVRDDDLSLKALGLLVKLLSLPDNWEFSENGLEGIFKKDGQTSIRSGLKELESNGYLVRRKVRDDKGRITKVEWLITENPHFENHSLDNPSLDNRPQYNTKGIKDEKNKTLTLESRSADAPLPASDLAFNSFWSTYPKKTGKIAARKAWDRIKPNAEFAAKIIKAVENQTHWEQWTAENGRYIPLPATWLNQGRWDDERMKSDADRYFEDVR